MANKITILIILGILIVLSIFIINNAKSDTTGLSVQEENVGNLQEVNLAIEDMYCEACAYGVKAQLEELDGVVNADINYKDASGVVLYDADKVHPETIAMASTVYPATVIKDRAA